MDERQRVARYCFGCGSVNPQGMRLTRDRGRLLAVSGELHSQGGQLLARGEGLFMRVPAEREQELREIYLGSGSGAIQLPSSDATFGVSSGEGAGLNI